jgi:hypothetical protein
MAQRCKDLAPKGLEDFQTGKGDRCKGNDNLGQIEA